MSVYNTEFNPIFEEILSLQRSIEKIDVWIDEYEGKNLDKIDKKLEQQEQYLSQLSRVKNVYVNSI